MPQIRKMTLTVKTSKISLTRRKNRNNGLYVAFMRTAIRVGDDPGDKECVPKEARKKLRKDNVKMIHWFSINCSIGDGLNIGIIKSTRTHSKTPKMRPRMLSTYVLSRWSSDSLMLAYRMGLMGKGRTAVGYSQAKKVIAVPQGLPWYLWMPFSVICTSVTIQTWFLPRNMLQCSVPKYWLSRGHWYLVVMCGPDLASFWGPVRAGLGPQARVHITSHW